MTGKPVQLVPGDVFKFTDACHDGLWFAVVSNERKRDGHWWCVCINDTKNQLYWAAFDVIEPRVIERASNGSWILSLVTKGVVDGKVQLNWDGESASLFRNVATAFLDQHREKND
jgi:hypothetical protein